MLSSVSQGSGKSWKLERAVGESGRKLEGWEEGRGRDSPLWLYLGLFALFSESLELTQFTANPCCILKTTYHIPPTDPIPLSFFLRHTGWASFDACPGKILKATLHFHHLRHILYLSRTTSASKCPSEPLLIISSSAFNPPLSPPHHIQQVPPSERRHRKPSLSTSSNQTQSPPLLIYWL